MHDALVTLLVAITPGIAALLIATAAYIQAAAGHLRAAEAKKVATSNTQRLDHLENGGGDAKIDSRLAGYGLLDRRGGSNTPTVGPQAPQAPPQGQTGGNPQ